jgi:acyl-CoA synthetase (AMP-forming)/AMP-acid ligase II
VDPGDPRARRLVSAGTSLKDTEVSIDRHTSEIVIRSRSLACGYFDNAEETRAHFSEGAFRTSDLGFLHEGHLYVSGRSDDLLILHGRNIFVNELELRVGAVPGIRDGNCAFVQEFGNGRRRDARFAAVPVDDGGRGRACGRMRVLAEGELPHDAKRQGPATSLPSARTPASARDPRSHLNRPHHVRAIAPRLNTILIPGVVPWDTWLRPSRPRQAEVERTLSLTHSHSGLTS